MSGDTEARMHPCGTCGRIGRDQVLRCPECERLQRFDRRIDPTKLFEAIEAEALICELKCGWEEKLEHIERAVALLKDRIGRRRQEGFEEAYQKEAKAMTGKTDLESLIDLDRPAEKTDARRRSA